MIATVLPKNPSYFYLNVSHFCHEIHNFAYIVFILRHFLLCKKYIVNQRQRQSQASGSNLSSKFDSNIHV